MTMLFKPQEYRPDFSNGCGSRDGIDVPDTVYGLSITASCNIHDFMYAVGTTIEDKKKADRVFMNNMVRQVRDGGWILRPLRLARVHKYYLAVKYFGASAFWEGKNKSSEMVDV